MDEKAARLEAPDSLGELPWLVCTHGNSKRKQVQSFYSPIINSKACIKSIPQLRHKKLLMSKHGWLLLQDRSQVTNLSLFNPVTSQAIGLPPILQVWLDDVDDDEPCFSFCVLTLPPDRDDCMLLLCLNSAGLLAFCRPAQPDCTWVTQPLELQEGNYDLKSLAVKPLQTIMDPDVDFYPDCHLSLMLESCGHLYNVILYLLDRRIIAVKVLELNLQQKQNSYYCWVEVKSLNGRAFFISNNDASWCWGDSIRGIAGNCIYLSVPELLETLYFVQPARSNLHHSFSLPELGQPLRLSFMGDPSPPPTTTTKQVISK